MGRPTSSASGPWKRRSTSTICTRPSSYPMGIDHEKLTYRHAGWDFRLHRCVRGRAWPGDRQRMKEPKPRQVRQGVPHQSGISPVHVGSGELGQDADDSGATHRGNERQADPGVARGRLDEGCPGAQNAARFGVVDDGQGVSILDTSTRLEVLAFGQDRHGQASADVLELYQGSSAEVIEDGRHADSLCSGSAKRFQGRSLSPTLQARDE